MSDKYTVKTFKEFEITYNKETINVSKVLGKQLVNLFLVLLYHRDRPLPKEELIEILWQQSENPTSALKFSVYRFRHEIQKIPFFVDKEIVITTKQGYQLNPELEWSIDFEEFSDLWSKLQHEDTLNAKTFTYAFRMYKIYDGKFYVSNSQLLWMIQLSETFRQMYAKTVMKMCQYLISKERFEEMMQINYSAIMLEPFYEGLHYYYMKGLIETDDYHQALNYYDDLNEVFVRELGVGLSDRFKELYNVIIEDHKDIQRTSVNDLLVQLSQKTSRDSGFFCTFDMFKYIFELLVKMAYREGKSYHLILINVIEEKDTDSSVIYKNVNDIKKIIGSCLRNNDVFAKINEGQFIILVDCQKKENAYLIVQRISKKFYNKYRNKGLHMHYEVEKARFVQS